VKAPSAFANVWLHREPVDMRRAIDGLSAIVRHEMKGELDGPNLFVFVSRCRSRVKCLYWDRTGFALWYKRLERSRFPWPDRGAAVVEIPPRTLAWLLDGIDVFRVRPHGSVEIAANW
jgi:transposase